MAMSKSDPQHGKQDNVCLLHKVAQRTQMSADAFTCTHTHIPGNSCCIIIMLSGLRPGVF